MAQDEKNNKFKFTVVQDEHFIDLNLYQFGWEKCEPLHSFGPYIRNHYLFHYVISGKGVLKANEQEYAISAGSGFLICPKQITSYIADQQEPWEYAWIEFDGLNAPIAIQQAGLSELQPVYTPASKSMGNRLKEEIMTIVDLGDAPVMCLIGHGFLFLELLIRGSGYLADRSSKRIRDFYIKEALSFIEQNYQRNISVEDIADFCGLNRSYFGRIFRDTMGESPQKFVIIYRMAKAEYLLRGSMTPINEISAMVGYENPLHFSRAFKEIYHVSPREFRQKHYGPIPGR